MSVATSSDVQTATDSTTSPSPTPRADAVLPDRVTDYRDMLLESKGVELQEDGTAVRTTEDGETHEMGQMGAKQIGSLAIGIAVVSIVINEMAGMEMVNQSDGVVDVEAIFQTAGSGLNLLVLGVIIAAAAVLLNLWSGF